MHSISSSLPNPTSMAMHNKLEKQAKEMKKNTTTTTTTNNNNNNMDVIITVYVESPSPLNTQIPHGSNTDHIKKIKPKPTKSKNPSTSSKAQGYDRRAQLLAYAQELRNSNPQKLQWTKNGSRSKAKQSSKGNQRLSASAVKLHRIKNGKRYQRLVPAVDVSCSPNYIFRKKKNASRRTGEIKRNAKRILQGRVRKNLLKQISRLHQISWDSKGFV
ncbi:uncharacterized protein LOC107435013 isoform X1 [Ziziphus jujuba]|uniref:Uncharacterized protein LOC107435013 isoform X1 n=1 Tax=Ziziphus jujuba TaxID=326968 RepID=A0ABM3IMS4_ZIZJJ|nr:uncharacterized protein LOC107435013 isoform X1 [Ziziphus jujuba]